MESLGFYKTCIGTMNRKRGRDALGGRRDAYATTGHGKNCERINTLGQGSVAEMAQFDFAAEDPEDSRGVGEHEGYA
jgi:hypothetical protein